MHRALVTLAVAAVLLLTATTPSSAATTVSLRYWPTTANASVPGGAVFGSWQTAMASITIRHQFNPNWTFSFQGDFGGQTNWTGTWVGASSGTDSFWSLNLHRTWMGSGGTGFGVFAGYTRGGYSSVFPAFSVNAQSGRISGWRVGAEVMHMAGPWSVNLWGATGVGTNFTFDWPGLIAPETVGGQHYELAALLGYQWGSWTLDAGWRKWYISSPGTTSSVPFNLDWSGFIVGVTRRLP